MLLYELIRHIVHCGIEERILERLGIQKNRVLQPTIASKVDLTLVSVLADAFISNLTNTEWIALIGIMLSDLLVEGVKFGNEGINSRPNEMRLAMSRKDW